MKLKFQDEIVKTIKLKQQNHSIECSLKVHLILLHNFTIWICMCLPYVFLEKNVNPNSKNVKYVFCNPADRKPVEISFSSPINDIHEATQISNFKMQHRGQFAILPRHFQNTIEWRVFNEIIYIIKPCPLNDRTYWSYFVYGADWFAILPQEIPVVESRRYT